MGLTNRSGTAANQMIEDSTPATHSREKGPSSEQNFGTVLLTTFVTVFLAELGDKTQIATLLLSAQSGRPAIVFIAASIALICSSLVGVLLGRWFSSNFSMERVESMAGVLMIGLGIWIAIQSSNSMLMNIS